MTLLEAMNSDKVNCSQNLDKPKEQLTSNKAMNKGLESSQYQMILLEQEQLEFSEATAQIVSTDQVLLKQEEAEFREATAQKVVSADQAEYIDQNSNAYYLVISRVL